jgi:hypothetical protein
MQSKEELENWYKNVDPWGYTINEEDHFRKKMILDLLAEYSYLSALDVGCGEGFITKDLPAKNIYGYDVSDTAMSRLPDNIIPYADPYLKYDLVVTTGTLYNQYDHEGIVSIIKNTADRHILVAGIKDWLIEYNFGNIIKKTEFQYRGYIQLLKLYEL